MLMNMQPELPYSGQQQPTINFSPMFKIMNGGNDFSTDDNLNNQNNQGDYNLDNNNDIFNNNNVNNDIFNNNSNNNTNNSNNSNNDNKIQEGGKKIENEKSPGLLDFGKLLIKKLI